MKDNWKKISLFSLITLFVFLLIFGGISLTKNIGKSDQAISDENATEKLSEMYNKLTVNNVAPRKGTINVASSSMADVLPDISKYPPVVDNSTDTYIEIFSSPEKAGEGKDGWLKQIVEDFNKEKIEIDGKIVSVKLRSISSGTGMDYITSGKYVPDAYTPSNSLWGELVKSKGVQLNTADEKMVGNVGGILLTKAKNDEIVSKYGSVNLKNVAEATINGEIQMGYTNPLSSSTGLNFLVSTLSTFDSTPLSEAAISEFEKFQNNIPLIAYTTLQMSDSAKSGILDGMVFEYQLYENSPELKSDYVFTPFGYRHDNPLYTIGDLSQEKKDIISKFVEYSKQDKYQELATKYGFNQMEDYSSELSTVDGDTIRQCLKVWKEKKNNNKSISAVFVSDVSGSMEGEPLNKLKESLLNSSQYIGDDASIGFVSYSDMVNINLPIAKFDLNQRSLFAGTVSDLSAGGGTATFDAVIVATKMLLDEREKNPDAKLMMFVCSDGETNRGHSLNDIKDVLEALRIPVYTIGYNADIKALQSLSSINEAASINADSDDVVYSLGNLFNAEM